jgi:hypothetical protein
MVALADAKKTTIVPKTNQTILRFAVELGV